MLNTVWQASITHGHLGKGYKPCWLAPYLLTITNEKGQRQCTFFGFDNFLDAYQWYQQAKNLGHRVALRLAERVNTRYEVKSGG